MDNNYNKCLCSKARRSVESFSVFTWKSARSWPHHLHPFSDGCKPLCIVPTPGLKCPLTSIPVAGPTLMSALCGLFLQPCLPQPPALHSQLDYYFSLMLLHDMLKIQGSQAGIGSFAACGLGLSVLCLWLLEWDMRMLVL